MALAQRLTRAEGPYSLACVVDVPLDGEVDIRIEALDEAKLGFERQADVVDPVPLPVAGVVP